MLIAVLINQTARSDGYKAWLFNGDSLHTSDILCRSWTKEQQGCQAAKGDAHQPPRGSGGMGNLEIHVVPFFFQLYRMDTKPKHDF